jgi:hypothetical protein
VIIFTDHLSDDTGSCPSLKNSDCGSLVEFPSQGTSDQCSSQEVGKWVDKLMAMSDSEAEPSNTMPGSEDFGGDPFLEVASRILDQELS